MALQPLGLKLDPRYTVVVQQADRAEGAEAIHSLLPLARRKDFPTAFVTYNTQMSYGAALVLQREGWKVPGDISLASADVSRLSVEGTLRITGAGTSPDKLGEACTTDTQCQAPPGPEWGGCLQGTAADGGPGKVQGTWRARLRRCVSTRVAPPSCTRFIW